VAHLLELEGLTTGYGRVEVVHDLSVEVPAGTVVALLGANGAGKTTTLRAISGTLAVWQGSVRLDGRRIDGASPYTIARRGVCLVPEGRGVFPALSVEENLGISARAARGTDGDTRQSRQERIERVLATFPQLEARRLQRAGTLSGGEQQMLSLSRAYLANPRLLMVDEISMGLAPIVVEQLFESLAALKEAGTTILLVEQYLVYALRVADICYVMAKGRVAFVGEPAELAGRRTVAGYLGA